MTKMEDVKFEDNAELNPFNINAKSSVKLTKNSKGVNWEIKVVTGENDLIDGLMKSALACHKEIIKELR